MNVAMVNPKKKSSTKKKGKGGLTVARAKALSKAWKARGMPVPASIKRKAGGAQANPKRKKKRSNYGTKAGAKKAVKTRKRRYGVKGKRAAENPRRKRRNTSKTNPWVGPYKYRRKPSKGKQIKVKKHFRKKKGTKKRSYTKRRSMANPKKRSYRRKRRNPEFMSSGGFFPTFARIKSQFSYILPKRNMLYPTFADIKAHPVLAIVGFPVGFLSSSLWGGIGRLIGGKNVLISEVFGVAGNIIGFELPARLISMFNFKGKDVMAKSIRAGGIVSLAISAILGIFRIGMSLKKNGVGATLIPKKKNWGVGAITIPSFKEMPAKILKTIGVGALSMNNPISDIVTSGKKQGYTNFEPMGVSDEFLSGMDRKKEPDFSDRTPFWADASLGDPSLVDKIKNLAKEMGIGEAELFRMSKDMEGDLFNYDEQELDGIGQIAVPSPYKGGFNSEFVQ